MLKKLTILLINLLIITKADDGDKYNYHGDSNDELDDDFDIHIYQSDGVPSLRFYSVLDTGNVVYCFQFKESFEAYYYDANGSYSKIGDTTIDFSSLDWEYTNKTSGFEIYATSANNEELTKATRIGFDSNFNTSQIYFSINVSGYEWSSNANQSSKFVLSVRLSDCSDEYSYDDDDDNSNDDDKDDDKDDGDDNGDDNGDDDEDDDKTGIRRLLENESSQNETGDDGGSGDEDDDSSEFKKSHKEYDLDAAYFQISNEAIGYPNDDSVPETISAYLYQLNSGGDNDLHIVFEYFGHNLYQDPVIGVNDAEISSPATKLFINSYVLYMVVFFCYVYFY